MAKSELRTRYKAFADAYLSNGGNAYRAALAAGYSESFARGRSYELLDREEIQEYLTRRRQQMAKRAVSPERVLLELAAIGFADITDLAKVEAGRVVISNTDDVPGDTRKAIASIKEGKYGLEIKMADKVRALELMGKNLGLFDKDGQEAPEGVTIIDDIPE